MDGKININQEMFDFQTRREGDSIIVTINGKEVPVALDTEDEIFQAVVQGEGFPFSITDEQSLSLQCEENVQLAIEETPFQVRFEKARAEDMSLAQGAANNEDAVTAFMPGTIIKVMVEPGQEVQQNDVILILEAMKMENEVKPPRDGVVQSVHVQAGQAVNKNDLLIQLEEN